MRSFFFLSGCLCHCSFVQAETSLQKSLLRDRELIQNLLQRPESIFCLVIICAFILVFSTRLLQFLLRKLSIHNSFVLPRWGAMEVTIFGAIYLFLPLSLYKICQLVYPKWENHQRFTELFFLVVTIAYCGSLFLYLYKKNSLACLGLRRLKYRQFFLVIFSYLSFIPYYIIVVILTHVIFFVSNHPPQTQQVAEKLMMSKGFSWYFGIFTVIVIAPLTEEFIFRMFLYSGLKAFLGVPRSIILSSLIFAFLHQNLFAFLPIFALGIFLNLLYEKTQCLWATVLAHSFHNFLTLAYLLLICS